MGGRERKEEGKGRTYDSLHPHTVPNPKHGSRIERRWDTGA